MGKMRNAKKKNQVGKREGNRPLGRKRCRKIILKWNLDK
jgi:hypothetical protein